VAPQDSQISGGNLQKRKLRMVTVEIVINSTRVMGVRVTISCRCALSLMGRCFCYRRDAAKRQTAGIVFTHRPKIRFFAPQGRLVAPIRVKLCRTYGHLGPLGRAKCHVNRCRGMGMRPPKYQKFPLFGKESPRRGDYLDRLLKFLGTFTRLSILQ